MRAVRHSSIFAGVLISALLAGSAIAYAAPTPAATSAATTISAATTTPVGVTTTSVGVTTAPGAPTTTGASTRSRPVGQPCTTKVTAAYPVVCLPNGFGEDMPAQLQPGELTEFVAQLVDNGPAAADATLTVTLPAQLEVPRGRGNVLRFDDNATAGQPDFAELHCARSAGTSTVTCDVGPIAQGDSSLLLITLVASGSAKPDTSAAFTVGLSPVLPDVYPSTSVSATVDFLAVARLRVSIDPTSATIDVGDTKRLVGSIANIGTTKASDTFALAEPVALAGSHTLHFRVTNGHQITLPTGGGGSGGGTVTISGSASVVASASVPGSGPGSFSPTVGPAEQAALESPLDQTRATRVQDELLAARPRISASVWSVGTIAPGHTAVVKVDVKALSVGRGRLGFLSLAENEDMSCLVQHPSPGHPCNFVAVAHLRAVVAPSPSPSSSSSSAALADTGPTKSAPLLFWALLALVAGATLSLIGRRQVRGRHRH